MTEEVQVADEALGRAVAKIELGEVDYKVLVDLLAPKASLPVPEQLPAPREIKESEREAITRLPEVFGRVIPEARRVLSPVEASALMEERLVLDTIKTMAEERAADIRTSILNANDVRYEASTPPDERDAPRDKDGHWCVKERVRGQPSDEKEWSCEPSAGTAGLNPAVIQALADDPDQDWISHDDWLECSDPVRVLNQHKLMLLIRRKPHLVRLLRDAAIPAMPSISVQKRRSK